MMKWNPSKSPPPNVTAHRTVAFVAEQLAYQTFEELRYDNEFNKMVEEHDLDEKKFAEYFAPHFRKGARTILTAQLTDPSTPEMQKSDIMEALALDQILPKGGVSAINKKMLQ